MLKDHKSAVLEDENFIMDEPVKGVATEAMGLVNSGALVKRIYEASPPFAFVREFIKNSIQAGATRIEIGPDFVGVKTSANVYGKPIYKLMFSDNGEGIHRSKMKTLLNNLSSSGRSMASDGNFGIGAKVAALPWNSVGISFMSWTGDNEGMVRLFKRSDGNYGLHRFNEGDEDSDNFVDLSHPPESYQESWQKPTGTSVVLFGNDTQEDTLFGPPSEDAGLYGLIHVVNDRFFEVPEGVNVSVCVFENTNKAKWPKTKADAKRFYRKANGSKYFLDKYSKESGTIKGDGFKLHWWWHPEVKSSGFDSYTSPLGYVGTVYDGELYDVVRKQPSRKSKMTYNYALVGMYAKFGLFFEEVWNNVTIVVEPDKYSSDNKNGVFPDLARGQLRTESGDGLPWDVWGKSFISNMPAVIADALEAASSGTESEINLDDKLKEYFDLMDIYSIHEPGPSRKPSGNVPRRKAGKSKKVVIGNDTGEYKPTKYHTPSRNWIKPSDAASEVDLFQGKALFYEEGANTVLFNKDFPLWQKMQDRWTARYPAVSGVQSKVREAVKYAYEVAVVLRIVHVRKFRGKADWNAESMAKALSNESLTMSVLGLQDADSKIANYLKGTLRVKRLDRGGKEDAE